VLFRSEELVAESLARVQQLCGTKRGQTPARILLSMPAGYLVTLDCSAEMKVYPDEQLILELERVRGVAQVLRC
jgi:hypothetical protein